MFRQTFEELKLIGQLPSPPGVVTRMTTPGGEGSWPMS